MVTRRGRDEVVRCRESSGVDVANRDGVPRSSGSDEVWWLQASLPPPFSFLLPSLSFALGSVWLVVHHEVAVGREKGARAPEVPSYIRAVTMVKADDGMRAKGV